MKIAVTAVSGKLGSAIARALRSLSEVESVVGLARTPEKARGLGFDVRPGDYGRPDDLIASLAGMDTVLLVSGMDAPDKRVAQHRNVIEAAKAAGVRKIVYTSIQGIEEGTGFSPVVQSNRQTEADVRASGLVWAIGRNGIYIEPDVEYVENYKMHGEIANCAGEGVCGYTTREELAYAYAQMLTSPRHDGQTYNLHGEPITQRQLAGFLNQTFETKLTYHAMSVEEYRKDRTEELGSFLGGIIAGIYHGIHLGAFDAESQYQAAAGRSHQSWDDFFEGLSA